MIKKINKKINKYYSIYSYNKFVEKLSKKRLKLKETLLIIDEVQNIVSSTGKYYKIILNAIEKAPDDLRIILLSGTPMFDKPVEIALTMNLLKLPEPLPTGNKFNEMFLDIDRKRSGKVIYKPKNLDLFKDYIQGYVSYYRGAHPVAFQDTEIKIERCKMSD